MRSINKNLLFLVIGVLGINSFLYAQPEIPKEKMPHQLPNDVRGLVQKLYSSDPKERTWAAHDLGAIGENSIPAIPFLVAILSDNARKAGRP